MTTQPLKLRAPVPFPANVTGSGGIGVTKENGIWTIAPSFGDLATVVASAITNPTLKQIWIYDPATNGYNVLTLAGLGDALYKTTSTTSLAISIASKAFTIQAGKDYTVGDFVLATSDASPTANYMCGQITAYSGTTLTVNVTVIGGSGTHTDWTIRVSGSVGATGPTAGIRQNYSSTTTDADPGAGTFRLNNATPASATAAYLDNLDSGGSTVSTIIDLWDDSTNTTKGFLRLEKSSDPTVWVQFAVTGSVVDGTGYRKLTLTSGAGSGAFTNGDGFSIMFYRSGDAGSGAVTTFNGRSATVTPQADDYAAFDVMGVPWNFSLAASVGSSALTIAIKDKGGSDASATSPIVLNFRNATLATGTPSSISVTGASSLVVSSGSTLGTSNNTPFRLWIVAFNDAGTFRLGVINASTSARIFPVSEYILSSSTAEGGAGAADNAGTFYTGTAVTTKAFRILGFMSWNSGLGTAGTWSAGPDVIQLFGPAVHRPGSVVQGNSLAVIASQTTITATSIIATSLAIALAPTSPVNLVSLLASGTAEVTDSNNILYLQFMRGGSAIGPASGLYEGSVSTALISPMCINYMDVPGTTASTTYAVGAYNSAGSKTSMFPANLGNSTGGGFIQVVELMA